MSHYQIQNTIQFELTADRDVTNDTVKLIATVNAVITPDQSDAQLRDDVHKAIRKLIDADWNISNVVRTQDQTGLERVALQATVRVSERENYNLDARAKEASRPGLTISVAADTSIPTAKIKEAQQALRLQLLADAKDECKRVNDAGLGVYKVRTVNFSNQRRPDVHSNAMRGTMYSAAATAFDGPEGGSFGNTEKLFLTATVTLAYVDLEDAR